LRANPTAEQTAEEDGEQDDEDNQCNHGQSDQIEVVRTEHLAEEDQLPVEEIEENVRVAVDRKEGSAEQHNEQERTDSDAGAVESA
jgi:hypothetical protein